MNSFTFSYPTKQYFGMGAAKTALEAEMHNYGKNVMLAYGGGSLKKNGIYDEILALLNAKPYLQKGAGGCRICKKK